MNNPIPDQSRTPELPHAVAWHAGLDCTCDGWISVAASRHGEFTSPLYEDYQLRDYGRACVAAAMDHYDDVPVPADCILVADEDGCFRIEPVTSLTPQQALKLLSENAQELGLDYVPAHNCNDGQCAVCETSSLAEEAHPESVCDYCRSENPAPWVAPNDLWNQVVGSPNGILCPSCFIRLAKTKGIDAIWNIEPFE